MASYMTEQEKFWEGEFGNEYIERNNSSALLAAKIAFWGRVLKCANGVNSIKEFGCNIGLNLLALKQLNPSLTLAGVEINERAALQAQEHGIADIQTGSILNPMDDIAMFDLSFTCGVLIHINPDALNLVYDNLYRVSKRYIVVSEYYNPSPVTVSYRGNDERLFKRDFAGDLIDKFNLKLVDYGFVYRRDNFMAQDDLSWFLLEK